MIGITAYSAYIPRYRLARKTIFSALGWLGQVGLALGERAVANYDEDSVTMAVAAGMKCIERIDRNNVEGLYFASTTAPYQERESAAIIATALNLDSDIRTVDFSNSLKSGTTALLAASEAVKSGGASSILVCSSDCRLGRPGGTAEMLFGDGGVALLVGREGVIASLEGSYCVSYDFPDHWRSQFDRYDRALEDRLTRDEGYGQFVPRVIHGLMETCGLQPTDIAKVVYPCLFPREFTKIANKLGLETNQIQESMVELTGDTGTASPLVMLVAALDQAKPGDNILVTSYGNGCTALWFKVTQEIERNRTQTLKKYLASKEALTNYEKYAAFRNILPVEMGMRSEVGPTALPVAWRERRFVLGLTGSICQRCGTPQLPPQRVCANPRCGAIDEMEPYQFSDKKGILFSYTQDNLASTINPPQMYGMIDFDGGGRYMFDITDCEPRIVEVGMPVEVTLRRKYVDEVRGVHGYFWKAMPLRFKFK